MIRYLVIPEDLCLQVDLCHRLDQWRPVAQRVLVGLAHLSVTHTHTHTVHAAHIAYSHRYQQSCYITLPLSRQLLVTLGKFARKYMYHIS